MINCFLIPVSISTCGSTRREALNEVERLRGEAAAASAQVGAVQADPIKYKLKMPGT
jgi:hypothetical protein